MIGSGREVNINRIVLITTIFVLCVLSVIFYKNSFGKEETTKLYEQKNDKYLINNTTINEEKVKEETSATCNFFIYIDSNDDLYIDNTNKKIASDVITYAVYKSDIYYSTEEGLFVYDIVSSEIKKLISTETKVFNGLNLLTIKMIKASESGLDFIVWRNSPVGSFNLDFSSNLDGSNFITHGVRPELNYNTFLVDDQGYFIKYPAEFCADLEYGSYLSGGVQLYHVTKDISMYVFNTAYFYDKPDVEEFKEQYDTKEIKADKGFNAYYYILEMNDENTSWYTSEGYHISCVTDNGFKIDVAIKDKNDLDYVEKVFVEIVKSIYKYEDIRYDDAE